MIVGRTVSCLFFFFNDTATTEIYTLSLHDALPICDRRKALPPDAAVPIHARLSNLHGQGQPRPGILCRSFLSRSEEHTSELQSRQYLVCRLLLEKKKKRWNTSKLVVLLFAVVQVDR